MSPRIKSAAVPIPLHLPFLYVVDRTDRDQVEHVLQLFEFQRVARGLGCWDTIKFSLLFFLSFLVFDVMMDLLFSNRHLPGDLQRRCVFLRFDGRQ